MTLSVAERPLLLRNVVARVSNEEHGDREAGDRDDETPYPDHGARCIRRRQRARDERRRRDSEVAGGLVEPEGKAAPAGPDEVDLHHDGHRPREPLARAEEEVRDDDEAPGGGKPDQHGDGQSEQPPEDEEAATPDPVGQTACGEVGERLRHSEGDDEGENRTRRGEAEVVLADQRKDAALEADHRSDQSVQRDEQRELGGVGAQAQLCGHARQSTQAPRRTTSWAATA